MYGNRPLLANRSKHTPRFDPSKVFFTSDFHLCHANILQMDKAGRPYATLEEMHEDFARRWNAVVPKDGHVFDLGDLAILRGPDKATVHRFLASLNGFHHYLLGNHSKSWIQKVDVMTLNLLASIDSYLEILVTEGSGQRICLSHYPMEVWNAAHRGAWHLHGHSHGSLRPGFRGPRLDVGVDCSWSNFAPLSYQQVKGLMAKLPAYEARDHHGRPGGPTEV